MARYAIIGGTIWGNRGAEAMLTTTIGQIRERDPQAEIVIFSYLPKNDQKLIRNETIAIYDARPRALVFGHLPFALLVAFFRLFGLRLPDALLSPSVQALRWADILLDISGISFADGRVKFLPFNILIIWPAMLVGTPVVKLSQAVGPFTAGLNRWLSRWILSKLKHGYARGQITYQHVRELGLQNWTFAPDVAFLYQPAYSLSDENSPQVDALAQKLQTIRDTGKIIVGLSPSSLVYAQSDHDYVAQFLRLMRALGDAYHFVLLPNATREGVDKTRNNDLVVIDYIQMRATRELPPTMAKQFDAVLYDINTAGSRRLIGLCDVLLTSRFHGMISALSLGVPVGVIGWSHKYSEILNEFDMGHFAVDFADTDHDLETTVRTLIEERDVWQQKIQQRLPTIQAQVASQFEALSQWLK